MPKRKCQHHWVLNDDHFGTCKKCGETKQFVDNIELDIILRREVNRAYAVRIPKEIKEEMQNVVLSKMRDRGIKATREVL